MCGRFTIFDPPEVIENQFQVSFEENYREHYNIRPYHDVWVVRRGDNNDHNNIKQMRWSLLPSNVKDPKKLKFSTSNARANTIDQRRSFKNLLPTQRCIIPVSGYYEWDQHTDPKEPYLIHLKSHKLMACAGLWNLWKNEDTGEEIYSCTMITTDPNEMLGKIHHRMPIIMDSEEVDTWLDRGTSDKEFLKSMLQQYPQEKMKMHRVGFDVNKASNNYPDLIKPVA